MNAPIVDNSRPTMWTTLGNMNVDALEHYIEWQKNGDAVVFIQVAKYNGEEVRRDTHTHVIHPSWIRRVFSMIGKFLRPSKRGLSVGLNGLSSITEQTQL